MLGFEARIEINVDVVGANDGRPSWSERAVRRVVCDVRWSHDEVRRVPLMSRCRKFGRRTRAKKSEKTAIEAQNDRLDALFLSTIPIGDQRGNDGGQEA